MVISIVVPVYKVEAYLNRCVDSILAQRFTDFELILVDDGSPDNSGKICDEYAEKDSRIKVIHQKNGGLSAARNAGIDIAEGEWISFVDSDDWLHPDYLRVLYRGVTEYNADIAVGLLEKVNDGTTVNDEPINPEFTIKTPEDFWVENRTNATVACGKLYKRSLFLNMRYPAGKYHEDEYVTYKFLFGCDRLIILNIPIYRYYFNGDSISRMNFFKRLPDILEAFSEHEIFFRHSPWQRAYRLEIEKYAEAYSDAIWLLRGKKDDESVRKTQELRTALKAFLDTHKGMIPFEKRKDIYIAAYPAQELFIRGFGYIKGAIKHG